jgi:hypothetical protein
LPKGYGGFAVPTIKYPSCPFLAFNTSYNLLCPVTWKSLETLFTKLAVVKITGD